MNFKCLYATPCYENKILLWIVEDHETRILKAFKKRKEDHRLSPCKVFRKYKISLSGNAKLS